MDPPTPQPFEHPGKGRQLPGKGAGLGIPGDSALSIGVPGKPNPTDPHLRPCPSEFSTPGKGKDKNGEQGAKGLRVEGLPYTVLPTPHLRKGLRPGPRSWEGVEMNHTLRLACL